MRIRRDFWGGTSARKKESQKQSNTLGKPSLARLFRMKYVPSHFSDKIKFVLLENYSLEITLLSSSYF